jgi:hypothetical protein
MFCIYLNHGVYTTFYKKGKRGTLGSITFLKIENVRNTPGGEHFKQVVLKKK